MKKSFTSCETGEKSQALPHSEKKNPPLCTHTHSDVLCALYRLAPRSSFSIRSA